ncbi:MAG TPA: DUF4328 domain-containing protein [Pyrinomonadaceae bacterium]
MFTPSAYPAAPAYQSPYKSADTRARVVRILLIVGAALNGVMLIFNFIHFMAPGTVITDDATDPTIIILALMEGGVALMSMGVYIATIVFFLMWMYRAFENLPAFGVHRGSVAYSSGWAIGSWFIPFVSLLVPYRATKELWNKSVPNTGTMFSELSPPAFFPIWWAFWLLSNFASNIYFRATISQEMSPETDAIFGAVTSILSIVAALLAMKVVAEIDKQQTESASMIGQGATTEPPLPDRFMNQPPAQSPNQASETPSF